LRLQGKLPLRLHGKKFSGLQNIFPFAKNIFLDPNCVDYENCISFFRSLLPLRLQGKFPLRFHGKNIFRTAKYFPFAKNTFLDQNIA